MAQLHWHFRKPSAKQVFSDHSDIFGGIRNVRQRVALKKLFFDRYLSEASTARYLKIARRNDVTRALFRAANSPDSDWRSHAYDVLSLVRPRGYSKLLSERVRTDDVHQNRFELIRYLTRSPTRVPLRTIEHAVFDSHRSVREAAAVELVKRKGFRYLAGLLDRFFPENAKRVTRPELFYLESSPEPVPISEIEKNRNAGRQVFLHRGVPVYLVDSKSLPPKEGAKLPALGKYIHGVLWLNSDPAVLPARFRRAIAEHEVGEMFSHDIAQGLTLHYLGRKGLLSDYWNFYKDKPFVFVRDRELQKLCEEYPKDFGRFRRFLR
ncbi:MAG: hypothetical protein J4215_04165 [Candidatus Diapherotrites archaeon]|uniref:Uncharacterized protein n=1 Tax=Candidatus Iainarchaeum sp. TaxID=3101447 RepID=A0A8T4L8A0_9ARCH|nr:hypothetical protein [Candidatus Diapherotrites archaeon]